MRMGFPVFLTGFLVTANSFPDWSSLTASLSSAASLRGPVRSPDHDECLVLGSNAYANAGSATGICKQGYLKQRYEFNLPWYVVDVRTEEDVINVVNFASAHRLNVSIKTTGNSYQGSSSTSAGSLMIWMNNYAKDGRITTAYTDSCGGVADAVLGIGSGENWNDVLEHVKGKYHIVTGERRPISAAGEWLMGGGLSFSSREYGIGVDQVVDFRVVLANGTAVTADACAHSDLFWALRGGGGGGSFGVVTHVHYKLHPVSEIVDVKFGFNNVRQALYTNPSTFNKSIDQWLEFWIQKSPYMDSRWSGFFARTHATLVFAGSLADAQSTFLDDFQRWYDVVLDKSSYRTWGFYRPRAQVHTSWYEYKGGATAAGDPTMTDVSGHLNVNFAAHIMPRSVVVERPDQVKALLLHPDVSPVLGPVNYFLGGKISDVGINETAVHPALRKGIWSIFTYGNNASQKVRAFIPNSVTGVCYNLHYGLEPNLRNACWGGNYARLYQLKRVYDPMSMFNCWRCVGYQGYEVEHPSSDVAVNGATNIGSEFLASLAQLAPIFV